MAAVVFVGGIPRPKYALRMLKSGDSHIKSRLAVFWNFISLKRSSGCTVVIVVASWLYHIINHGTRMFKNKKKVSE